MLLKCYCEGNTPHRANPSDAGLDLFSNVQLDNIVHGESVLVSTGFYLEIPHGYMGMIIDRSSMPSKKGLIVGSKIIDSGYSGELKVNLINVGKSSQTINQGDKVAQLILIPIIKPRLIPVERHELYNDPVTISNRGGDGFGSTGQ